MEVVLSLATAFFGSLVSIKVVKPLAERVELVDRPNERKHHAGDIPLVGGIATFIGVMLAVLLWCPKSTELNLYIISSAMMVFIGALDDRLDLSVRIRMTGQILIASIMIFGAGTYIQNLGDLVGLGNINLGVGGTLFTLAAIVGAINAYNMVDGIDGLVGSMAINTLAGLAILFLLAGNSNMVIFPLIIVMAIVPYLLFNLGFPSGYFKKIFMGDAGSMFIGLSVIWLLAIGSQGEDATFRPVTALWLIAVPLMDMAAIMTRRIQKGHSPFKPDREHLHHIFIRAGFSSRQALSIITIFAIVCSAMGIFGEVFFVPEWFMFTGFLVMFCTYCYVLKHIWRLLHFVRKNLTGAEQV